MLLFLAIVSAPQAATLTVDPTSASAYPDIETALLDATSGDIISLSAGTHSLCEYLNEVQLSFVGAGTSLTTLEVSSPCSAGFYLGTGVELTIENLTVDASAASALNMSTDNHVIATDVIFDGGQSGSRCAFINSISSFTGTRVEFNHCGDGSAWLEGAAMYMWGTAQVTLTDSAFRNNQANKGGAVLLNYFCGSPELTLDEVTFENNFALNDGGAIYLDSSAVYSSGSSFINNTAQDGSGGAIGGGGYLDSVGDIFTGNTASQRGGAIGDTQLNLEGAQFSDNHADSGGALSLSYGSVVSGSVFNDNSASTSGGAIDFSSSITFELSDSLFCANTAAQGGAISGEDYLSVILTQLRFAHNEASNRGGSLYFNVEGTVTESIAKTELRQSTVFGSTVPADGEGVLLTGGNVVMHNTLLTHTDAGAGLHLGSVLSADVSHSGWYANTGGDVVGTTSIDLSTDGHVQADPLYVTADPTTSCEALNLRLATGSTMRDAGDMTHRDPDGSPSDIGAYGGPDAPIEDHDSDGFTTAADCVDTDASVFPGATEVANDGIDQDCDGVDLIEEEEDENEDENEDESDDEVDEDEDVDEDVDEEDTGGGDEHSADDSDERDEEEPVEDPDQDAQASGCTVAGTPMLRWTLPLLMTVLMGRRRRSANR